jgi:hypothetical protein
MALKRDAVINLRVPAHIKQGWSEKAEGLNWPNLTSMIENAVEEYLEAVGGEAVEAEATTIVPRPSSPTPPLLNATDGLTPGRSIPVAAKVGCPGENRHRKGSFCKQCKKVI